MTQRLVRTAAAIFRGLTGGGHARAGGYQAGDDLMSYPAGDDRFAEAKRKAHATLPRFHELARAGLHGAYLVKMRLEGGGEVEHIWVEVTGLRGGRFQGRLTNDPVVPGYSAGDPVELHRHEIEDWMINTGEVRYGGYTVRAMLDDKHPAQAEELRGQLRD
jgi:uncharacterized protein YegJ (DUF2314 family)